MLNPAEHLHLFYGGWKHDDLHPPLYNVHIRYLKFTGRVQLRIHKMVIWSSGRMPCHGGSLRKKWIENWISGKLFGKWFSVPFKRLPYPLSAVEWGNELYAKVVFTLLARVQNIRPPNLRTHVPFNFSLAAFIVVLLLFRASRSTLCVLGARFYWIFSWASIWRQRTKLQFLVNENFEIRFKSPAAVEEVSFYCASNYFSDVIENSIGILVGKAC